jgi:Ni/Fe-hydrogenase subunit HybB-like protein
MWKIPIQFWNWNLNSPLLEVALCIMAYVGVLWLELSPAILERFGVKPAWLEKALLWVIALGLLLPTMHQSSLGTLMMLAGPKLHPLWFSPLLPLLFLLCCLSMGYGVVVFESVFSTIAFKRKPETEMLAVLQKLAVYVGLAFVAVRFVDLAVRGSLGYVARFDLYGITFWIETLLFVLPAVMLFVSPKVTMGSLFRGAMVIAFAGALYRFDTYLVGFQPGPGWHYFPSVPEMFISIGLISLELAAYVALVKLFPILGGRSES